ncbi:chitin binding peritrophin-A domain-containing protein [Tolypothrix bouteillei VB521301_2]
MQPAQAQESTGSFSCVDKPNGNYASAVGCTKFIMCSNGNAYEFDCPKCNPSDGDDRCPPPERRLYFNPPTDRCEWADESQCGPFTEGENSSINIWNTSVATNHW